MCISLWQVHVRTGSGESSTQECEKPRIEEFPISDEVGEAAEQAASDDDLAWPYDSFQLSVKPTQVKGAW